MSVLLDPVSILLDEPDPVRRSRAHTQLGQQALARQDVDAAREHLLEAADLDPTDEVPRRLLASLPTRKKRFFGLF